MYHYLGPVQQRHDGNTMKPEEAPTQDLTPYHFVYHFDRKATPFVHR